MKYAWHTYIYTLAVLLEILFLYLCLLLVQTKEIFPIYVKCTLLQGEPDCLQGLVFVLSGVYESLDREEASELIKRHGGKVTTSVSRNTSYLVLGNEAGESKIKKVGFTLIPTFCSDLNLEKSTVSKMIYNIDSQNMQ